MSFNIIIRTDDDSEPIYTRSVAAQLARMPVDLVRACERENLVRTGVMTGGGRGFSASDVRNLARIRRLLEDLGLDLQAVEVVLHLRRQVVDLLRQIEEQERRHLQREQVLLAEIQRLRRQLAHEASWRT